LEKFLSSNTIQIHLTNKKKEVKSFESVWIEMEDKSIHEVRSQEFLYKKFVNENPKSVYFLAPMEQIHQNVYFQKRLINRLENININDLQKAYCLRDIAKNLTWMHDHGMAHGDIHLKNVLFEERIDDQGLLRLVCYLTDFGSSRTFGAVENRKLDDYFRWDSCKCLADINTPLVDWQGFMITNIVAWLPEMVSELKSKTFISTRQMVFENESNGIFTSDEFYWKGHKPFTELTPIVQQAWHLFIAICRKSAQLYQHFKYREGEISKDEVAQKLIEVNAQEVVTGCIQFAEDICKNIKDPVTKFASAALPN
jgi:Protein kinase domain.